MSCQRSKALPSPPSHPEAALTLLRDALAVMERKPRPAHPATFRPLSCRARLSREPGRRKAALDWYARPLKLEGRPGLAGVFWARLRRQCEVPPRVEQPGLLPAGEVAL